MKGRKSSQEFTGASLQQQVYAAADAKMQRNGAVSILDLLLHFEWIHPTFVRAWGAGTMPSLVEGIRMHPMRVDALMKHYFAWGGERGHATGELRLTRQSDDGPVELRFAQGDREPIERLFRHQFVAEKQEDGGVPE